MWKATVLTIFPEMFPGTLGYSLAGKALDAGKWELEAVNIRNFAIDKHSTVDDKPFGGGAGMVMRPDVLGAALESVIVEKSLKNKKIIYMSPRGEMLNQRKIEKFKDLDELVIICGRYEGVDERFLDEYEIEEVSLGDFILSGGEIAALSLIDACVRRISGVLNNTETFSEESFGSGCYANLLEYPHYTRPPEWKGWRVPDVLLSGNHKDIEDWRLKKAEAITKERRGDLWKKYLEHV